MDFFGGKWKISGIGEICMTNFGGFMEDLLTRFWGFFSSVAVLTLNSSETTTT